jgi:threonine dehydrogenase-like Zn-dependent dehydrogenase
MTEAELTIVGSCASNVRGGLELLSSGAIDVLPMLSRAIGLDEAAASAREAIQSRAAIVVFVTP